MHWLSSAQLSSRFDHSTRFHLVLRRSTSLGEVRQRRLKLARVMLLLTTHVLDQHNLRLLSMGHHLTQPHHLHTNSLSNTLSPCHRLTLLT
jgi:hypothetical protein